MSNGVEVVSAFTGAAIQAAITKVVADAGQGVVLLNPGNYSVSAAIQLPTKITLQGAGQQTTVLTAAGDNTVLDVIGTASVNASGGISNHVASNVIADLAIDGGSNAAWSTKPLTRFYYAHTAEIRRVVFRNKFGIATLIGAECWDNTWWQCRWDGCGGVNQSLPAMVIQSADGATFPAFGSSTDATNDQRFFHCTWESFRDGALWVLNPSGAYAPGNIYFFGCKADQNQTALGTWFKFASINGIFVKDMDMSSHDGGAAYLGTPRDMFNVQNCAVGAFSGITHQQNGSQEECLINFQASGGGGGSGPNKYIKLEDINIRQLGAGSASYNTAMIKFSGTNTFFDIRSSIRYATGASGGPKPIFYGTMPTTPQVPMWTKAGAFTDADFGAIEPGVPVLQGSIVGIDTTNNRLQIRYPDGTYHYASLT